MASPSSLPAARTPKERKEGGGARGSGGGRTLGGKSHAAHFLSFETTPVFLLMTMDVTVMYHRMYQRFFFDNLYVPALNVVPLSKNDY